MKEPPMNVVTGFWNSPSAMWGLR